MIISRKPEFSGLSNNSGQYHYIQETWAQWLVKQQWAIWLYPGNLSSVACQTTVGNIIISRKPELSGLSNNSGQYDYIQETWAQWLVKQQWAISLYPGNLSSVACQTTVGNIIISRIPEFSGLSNNSGQYHYIQETWAQWLVKQQWAISLYPGYLSSVACQTTVGNIIISRIPELSGLPNNSGQYHYIQETWAQWLVKQQLGNMIISRKPELSGLSNNSGQYHYIQETWVQWLVKQQWAISLYPGNLSSVACQTTVGNMIISRKPELSGLSNNSGQYHYIQETWVQWLVKQQWAISLYPGNLSSVACQTTVGYIIISRKPEFSGLSNNSGQYHYIQENWVQ